LDEGYDSLRVRLAKYRDLAQKGLTPVPEGKILNAGQSDSPARIAALKARLSEEGYVVDSAPATPVPTASDTATAHPKPAPAVYTKALARAVGQFQSHHGIPVDSSLGEETVNAMNVSARYR